MPIIVGLTEPDEFNRVVAAAAVALLEMVTLPKVNEPPRAAVPPPTNVPALAAFVMRATLTLVSMVTVKLLE